MPTVDTVAIGFVPLPSDVIYYCTFVALLVHLTGVFIGLLTFCSNFGKPNDPTAKILLSIVASDLLFSTTACFVVFSAVVTKGFALGLSGCILNYYFIFASASVSILNLIIASIERYYAVVKGERWSSQTVNRILSVIWVYSIVLPLGPIFSDNYTAIRLEEYGWSCLVKWYGRDWVSLTITIISTIIFTTGFSIVAYCYMSVYRTFSNAIHTQKRVTEVHIQKERRVFLMCLMLTGSFLMFWSPSLLNIAYELVSGVPLDPHWSVASAILSSIPAATNSVILLYFDNRISGNVMRFLSRFRNEPLEVDGNPTSQTKVPTDTPNIDNGRSMAAETATKLIA